ncbi:MAG: hypothetical protein Q8O41_06325 [Candidatus Methanoperedens sp.]|nr:hypothetical protein [Candidatus Methanoperedens sp.]
MIEWNIGLKGMIKRIEKLLLILVLKNKPQINAKLYESFIKRGVCEAYPNTA